MSKSAAPRRLPVPTPETQQFWDGTLLGELRLQCCRTCLRPYFPPRPFCPNCGSVDVEIFAASGFGALYSYTISHRPAPGFEAPYCIAVVTLEEGPRMMANITGCPQTPEAITLDMPLEVTFLRLSDEIALPCFQPRKQKS